jgi:hypothetical protein
LFGVLFVVAGLALSGSMSLLPGSAIAFHAVDEVYSPPTARWCPGCRSGESVPRIADGWRSTLALSVQGQDLRQFCLFDVGGAVATLRWPSRSSARSFGTLGALSRERQPGPRKRPSLREIGVGTLRTATSG